MPFSLIKKGVSQYFCPYNKCKSHWCLVMTFLAQGLHLPVNVNCLSNKKIINYEILNSKMCLYVI